MREAAAGAPAVEEVRVEREVRRRKAAEVGPLRQVRLAEDHGARRAQVRDQRSIGRDAGPDQRQRAGRGLHRVVGGDVVLEQDRDAVQRTTVRARPAFAIEPRGDPDRLRVGLDDGAEQRVQSIDPPQVGLRQLAAGELAGCHERLQVRDVASNHGADSSGPSLGACGCESGPKPVLFVARPNAAATLPAPATFNKFLRLIFVIGILPDAPMIWQY